MVSLQRIWVLCLLVIAGSGPLPLWLHHIVHHSDGQCCQQTKPSETFEAAVCCAHDHDHVHAKKDAKTSVHSRADRTVVQWQSKADVHDDCAVCYTLSQLTTAQSTSPAQVGHLLSQYGLQSGDSQASLHNWLAYSSRGPPAV